MAYINASFRISVYPYINLMILGMMDFECFPLAFFCWGYDSSHILGDVNFLITGLLKWPIPWRPWEGMKVIKFYSQSLGPKHLLTSWKAQGICVTQFLGVKDPKALKMRTLGSSWETCWHPRSVVMMWWCDDVMMWWCGDVVMLLICTHWELEVTHVQPWVKMRPLQIHVP